MIEQIVTIPGMEDKYGITREGSIYSLNYRRLGNRKKLRPFVGNHGYKYIRLWKMSEENHFVHRLVAITFIPNPENKPEINHIDSNRLNNHVDNLEWVTKSGNCIHAYYEGSQTIPGTIIDKGIAYDIKGLLATTKASHRDIALAFGIPKKIVSSISCNQTWKHVVYPKKEDAGE